LVRSALAVSCLFASTAYADPSYPLICRGGPSMRIMVNHDVPDGVHTGELPGRLLRGSVD